MALARGREPRHRKNSGSCEDLVDYEGGSRHRKNSEVDSREVHDERKRNRDQIQKDDTRVSYAPPVNIIRSAIF